MNILIIDDQPNIISSLVAGIPWLTMGFTSIFTAQSAKQARSIIQNNALDIVISDIEMPNEDGLSLLRWARGNGYTYECILLTAHADFAYAKEAISLNVSEYVVQPAKNEDIIKAVNNALEKNKKNKAVSEVTKAGNFHQAAQNIVIKTLFEEWPTVEASIIKPELLAQRIDSLKQFGVECAPEWPCTIALIHIRKWNKLPLPAKEFLARYQQIVDEIFSESKTICLSYYVDDTTFYTLFFEESTEKEKMSKLYERLSSLGVSARLFYADTLFQYIRNVIDGLQEMDNQYALRSVNDIQLVEISSDELYAAAVGSDNYNHYNQLIHEFIQNNISDAITRTDIADYLKISPDNVSYIIKQTECVSVKELITRKKMEHAKALLQKTQHPISEVAAKCGYDSFAYFSKVYRATYGITPSQERQEG